MDILPLFPVNFFQGRVSNPEEILAEINSKRDQITQVSESYESQSVTTYKTDFKRPVKINSFESQIASCLAGLQEKGLSTKLELYWTAMYSGSGHHAPHTHARNAFDLSNYSGVLYLSEGSGTEFLSPSVSCVERSVRIKSEFGAVLLFPSTLLHTYIPVNILSTNERFIMSFNLSIKNLGGHISE